VQAAAVRIQAAWRGFKVRNWYRQFKKTTEFARRQGEYELQMRVRFLSFFGTVLCMLVTELFMLHATSLVS
jgi:hypothetical protein